MTNFTTDTSNIIPEKTAIKTAAWVCPVCNMGLRADIDSCNHVAPVPTIHYPYEILSFNTPVNPVWEIDLTPKFSITYTRG